MSIPQHIAVQHTKQAVADAIMAVTCPEPGVWGKPKPPLALAYAQAAIDILVERGWIGPDSGCTCPLIDVSVGPFPQFALGKADASCWEHGREIRAQMTIARLGSGGPS